MIVVKIELHSAIDKSVKTIGTAVIANEGTTPDGRLGDYSVRVGRRDCGSLSNAYHSPLRTGSVKSYPRLSYNVWRLVIRALVSAFPEENKRPKP